MYSTVQSRELSHNSYGKNISHLRWGVQSCRSGTMLLSFYSHESFIEELSKPFTLTNNHVVIRNLTEVVFKMDERPNIYIYI